MQITYKSTILNFYPSGTTKNKQYFSGTNFFFFGRIGANYLAKRKMAEAMTACRAVVFAQELSLSKVVVEGDCLQVVTTLNASGCCKTMYGNVVEETRRQARRLQQCQFQHVR